MKAFMAPERGARQPLPRGLKQGEGNLLNTCHYLRRVAAAFGYNQYCHWPVVSTHAAKIALVTACARIQSARLRVRTNHQL